MHCAHFGCNYSQIGLAASAKENSFHIPLRPIFAFLWLAVQKGATIDKEQFRLMFVNNSIQLKKYARIKNIISF
jgi:hypothetical protein